MKSKIRVELDSDNSPILEISVRGNRFTSNQDLADKILAKLFHDTVYFEIENAGECIDSEGGGSTDYILRPVKIKELYSPAPDELDNGLLSLYNFIGSFGTFRKKGLFLSHPEKHNTLLNLGNLGPQCIADELDNRYIVDILQAKKGKE